jgi:parallel beta-helix repeat protein
MVLQNKIRKNITLLIHFGFFCSLFAMMIDSGRGATFIVTNQTDVGLGTLRQAITSANSSTAPNTITFQISGTAPFTITPSSQLPALNSFITIDGTTQPGYLNKPIIELNGSSAGFSSVGLQLQGNDMVSGLIINRFLAQGIILSGGNNIVQKNYIGTDVNGTLARGNGSYGIWVQSSGNLIGGTNAGTGNVISANNTGIYVFDANGNTIQGNLIGLTASGLNSLGNVNNGIVLDSSSGNIIGGTNAPARNVISGNGQSGIYLNSSAAFGNTILGNFIGTGISGSTIVANSGDGITLIGSPANTIGNNLPGGGNVISGNTQAGIALNNNSSTGNVISGNLIGTDVSGKTALGNSYVGIVISAAGANQIGGTASGSGNVISGNSQDGIALIDNAIGNVIQNNLIGLSADGSSALHNGFNGISLSGAISNTIGGMTSLARNVISGNAYNGIGILLTGDNGNMVLGNYIGTDITGLKVISNNLAGIRIQGCSNTIGSANSAGRNIISGNGQQGVWLIGVNGNVSGNLVQGNFIGLDPTGTSNLGNKTAGIGITSAARNQIGGMNAGAGNVISANGAQGIFFVGAGNNANQIQGNFIGTDIAGRTAVGNFAEGIYMQSTSSNNILGNLVSGNYARGIWLTNAIWNIIQGNFIGTKADGTNALGNTFHGIDVDVDSSNNIIGGTATGAGNHIAFAGTIYAGVRVRDGSGNNLISGNSIFNNGALGIDLSSVGANPIYDCQSGMPLNVANAGQNYPIISNVYSGNLTRIRGKLDSSSGKTYTLQFFSSPVGDSSGYGEGQIFLGQTNLTLGAMCSSNFTCFLPVQVPSNWVVTATATDPNNNTSEFSAWVSALYVPPVLIASGKTSNNQTISWLNNGGTYTLQQTLNLAPPQWTTVNLNPSLSNGLFSITVSTTNAGTFYRLIAP